MQRPYHALGLPSLITELLLQVIRANRRDNGDAAAKRGIASKPKLAQSDRKPTPPGANVAAVRFLLEGNNRVGRVVNHRDAESPRRTKCRSLGPVRPHERLEGRTGPSDRFSERLCVFESL